MSSSDAFEHWYAADRLMRDLALARSPLANLADAIDHHAGHDDDNTGGRLSDAAENVPDLLFVALRIGTEQMLACMPPPKDCRDRGRRAYLDALRTNAADVLDLLDKIREGQA